MQKLLTSFLIASILPTCSNSDELTEGTLILTHELPAVLAENSGMAEFNGLLWFVNDGGNEPILHGFDTKLGSIRRQVYILDTDNIDWEEITQDESHFYIGDFGNNSGNRRDLRIIILDKEDIQASDSIRPSGIINFSYADQTDFTPLPQHTQYDCEAFVVQEDSVLLFTKDWIREETVVYTLPAKEGEYLARPGERFDSAGLITGATCLNPQKQLILLGYSNYIPFIWIIQDFTIGPTHLRDAVRIDFTSAFAVQAESLVMSENGSMLVASEGTAVFPARLYRAEY
ncbi:MAG: hypothetical protein JXA61_08420 [Bacteroidales bacterium]|nr:hypothetical protein [Bacteroidales bacterium]